MAVFSVPAGHYRNITVRGEVRETQIRETHDGSSPDYDFSEESASCSRTFYTPWGDQGPQQIREDILGNVGIGYHKATPYISRRIPMEHPNFLDTQFAASLRLTGHKGEPRGADPQDVQAFDEYVAHVSYQQFPYRIMTDSQLKSLSTSVGGAYPDEGTLLRNVTIDQQTAAKYQTVPAMSSLVWTVRAGAPAPDAIADGGPNPGEKLLFKSVIILFEGDLVITWHEVPLAAYPINAITALVGKTNSSAFGHADSVAGIYPAETLVAGPPRRKLRRLRDGQLGYDITYAFKYYPQGANKNFFMETGKTSGYYPFANDINGTKKLFPLDSDNTTDNPAGLYRFEDLFRPNP